MFLIFISISKKQVLNKVKSTQQTKLVKIIEFQFKIQACLVNGTTAAGHGTE